MVSKVVVCVGGGDQLSDPIPSGASCSVAPFSVLAVHGKEVQAVDYLRQQPQAISMPRNRHQLNVCLHSLPYRVLCCLPIPVHQARQQIGLDLADSS